MATADTTKSGGLPLVRMEDVSKLFPVGGSLLRKARSFVHAVDGVSFELPKGESLGLVEKDGCIYIVMKYTMELELVTVEALQRHVYAFQEIADQLDTELVKQFGGSLRFEEWTKLNQEGVDTLLDDLFG